MFRNYPPFNNHKNPTDWLEKEGLANQFLNKISGGGVIGVKNEIKEFLLYILKPSNKTLMQSPNLLQYLPKEKRDDMVRFNNFIDYDKDKIIKKGKYYHYDKQIGAMLSLLKRSGKNNDKLDYYSFEDKNHDIFGKIHDIFSKNIETK